MTTTQHRSGFIRFSVSSLLGLIILAALALQAPAQDQPKPGPEHQKLAVLEGEWTYEGTLEPSPLSPAGPFKGKVTTRLVLNGFFLESRWKDNVAEGIYLRGYDTATKTYSVVGFENDGSTAHGELTITGNTWIETGTRKDSKGKPYKTRQTITLSAEGRTAKCIYEYSADDGKTWLVWFKETDTLVKK